MPTIIVTWLQKEENDVTANAELIKAYNYDSFTAQNVERWVNFKASPVLGQPAPDFPLWTLDGRETTLNTACSVSRYLIVEFGSFT